MYKPPVMKSINLQVVLESIHMRNLKSSLLKAHQKIYQSYQVQEISTQMEIGCNRFL